MMRSVAFGWMMLWVTIACSRETAPPAASTVPGGGAAAVEAGTPSPSASSPWMPPATENCRDGFCRIEPGTFTMGAPREEFGIARYSDIQVQVTLTRPFLIGQTEVTRAEWALVGWEQPRYISPGDGPSKCTEPDCPVDTVTFFDAIAFANRFSETKGLATCYVLSGCTGEIGNYLRCDSVLVNGPSVYDCEGYRLPTEAEWEYAARAGTTTAFYTGDILRRDDDWSLCYKEPNLEEIGWYCFNSDGRSHLVGQKQPNGWGLYDMLGNVYEYCNDLMEGRGYGEGPLTDPTGTLTPDRELMPQRAPEVNLRVIRGGGYFGLPLNCKTNRRLPEIGPAPGVGFRLARTLSAAAAETGER